MIYIQSLNDDVQTWEEPSRISFISISLIDYQNENIIQLHDILG